MARDTPQTITAEPAAAPVDRATGSTAVRHGTLPDRFDAALASRAGESARGQRSGRAFSMRPARGASRSTRCAARTSSVQLALPPGYDRRRRRAKGRACYVPMNFGEAPGHYRAPPKPSSEPVDIVPRANRTTCFAIWTHGWISFNTKRRQLLQGDDQRTGSPIVRNLGAAGDLPRLGKKWSLHA